MHGRGRGGAGKKKNKKKKKTNPNRAPAPREEAKKGKTKQRSELGPFLDFKATSAVAMRAGQPSCYGVPSSGQRSRERAQAW